jgi:hypothetical protein
VSVVGAVSSISELVEQELMLAGDMKKTKTTVKRVVISIELDEIDEQRNL